MRRSSRGVGRFSGRGLRRRLTVGAVLLSLATIASATDLNLRRGGPWTTSSNLHRGMEKFAEVAGADSKGRIKVALYPDSQLGDIQQLLTGVQLGTIDMAYLAVGNAGQLNGRKPLNVAYVPHLFRGKRQATDTLNGPIFAEMYETLANSAGVRIFAVYGARSPRAVQTMKGSVRKPEDLEGMRICIPPIDMLRAAFELAGAKPVPMGLSDVYMALSRGNVDGQDNGFDLAIAFKWYEVAKFWSTTNHVFEVAAWYMNERKWQSVSPDDRDLFRRVAKAGGQVATGLGEALDRDGIETLRKAGVTYVEPDLAAFDSARKDSYRDYDGKVRPAALVERIRATLG